jgi:hypothetical protein
MNNPIFGTTIRNLTTYGFIDYPRKHDTVMAFIEDVGKNQSDKHLDNGLTDEEFPGIRRGHCNLQRQ